MAFKLRIKFTGLCLFVPDKTSRLMHVLMPDTTGHPGMRHEVKLEHGQGPAVEMEGWVLDLTGLSGGLQLTLPKEIVNLSPILDARVDLANVEPLISKVILGAGRVSHRKGLAEWKFNPDPLNTHLPSPAVYMANWAMWTAQVPGSELKLVRVPLRGGQADDIVNLKPGGDLVCLTVSHVPPNEVFMSKPPGYRPEHLHMYFPCLPGAKPRVPVLTANPWSLPDLVDGETDDDRRCVPTKRREKEMAGIAYSCMIASADPTT